MHEDAPQRAVAVAVAGIDRQVVADRAEHPLLQQDRRELVPDLELPGTEGGLRGGHQGKVQPVAEADDDQAQPQRRARQLPVGQASGAHHHQLAVRRQADIGEERHDEGGDRQDDSKEARQQQAGELQENQEGQAPVEHQLDEAQRLSQPDERCQPHRNGKQGDRKLTKHVTIEAGHQVPG